MDELESCARLARVPGITAAALTGAARSAGGLTALADHDWRGLAESPRSRLRRLPAAQVRADLAWIRQARATLVPCTSALYPRALACLSDAPPVLYVLGDPRALAPPQLAMVGARSATPTGLALAHALAAELAAAGLTITSGLALGVDAAAHAGALAAGGRTVAVCAHGLDQLYPRENRTLAAQIRTAGALVSRFAPGISPRRACFPQRNRLLAGLALGTLVVEAAVNSGSLSTARCALQHGRAVFAVPGSPANPLARGCHALIREGARLVECAADVLAALELPLSGQRLAAAAGPARGARTQPGPLDKAYEMLLDALGFEPVSINTLVERTGLPSGSIASMLLILELGGRIALHRGGRYCRLS